MSVAIPNTMISPSELSKTLLIWYDENRRSLPWRALPNERPDPYRVWLSEIMLQQTTVQSVKPFFIRFLELFPTVEDLATASSEAVMTAWAGLGYYSRARNLHKCAQIVFNEHDGHFPSTEDGLRKLPGIGPYTAAAVAAIAFNQPAAAVDGNVERVISRLEALEKRLPAAKPLIHAATRRIVPEDRPGDFAQALMDLGAMICTPKRPICHLCPWQRPCVAYAQGTQERYPQKAAKPSKPTRIGFAFVALNSQGAILLRTRAPKGLLGGMAEAPTTEWLPAPEPHPNIKPDSKDARFQLENDMPFPANWRAADKLVRHVFTHFTLELTVLIAHCSPQAVADHRWVPLDELHTEPLSNLMRKVIEAGCKELQTHSTPHLADS